MHSELIIEEHLNNDFLYKILKLKLKNNNLVRFKNEKYFIIRDKNGVLYGISRLITSFTKEEKELLKTLHIYNDCNFRNMELEKCCAFLGIWISDAIREKGFESKLIKSRGNYLKEKKV